jgi:hypothetical protein
MSTAAVLLWARIMLIIVGMCELLMAAGATAGPMAIGLVGGLAVIGGAVVLPSRRATGAALLVVGTVPFAIVAWSALVPVVVLIVVAGLATTIYRSDARLV